MNDEKQFIKNDDCLLHVTYLNIHLPAVEFLIKKEAEIYIEKIVLEKLFIIPQVKKISYNC